MACLIKAPDGARLGCVSFTTQERDHFMRKDAATLAAIEALKDRFLIGLHHNWHDFSFLHDATFDFSMAGEADLIERSGKVFDRTPIDCCNFVPETFFQPRDFQPFWDVINVTREAFFKGHAEFLEAIRAIYDQGHRLRVLHLCPVPRAKPGENPLPEIRRMHEAMFSVEERRSFTLMTMDWDHPRPLDLETLSFFYRAAKVFVHTAPDERRCRIAAYAWANQMPVVARDNVASILPPDLRRAPFWFGYDDPGALPGAILAAVNSMSKHADWREVTETFRPQNAAERLSQYLDTLAIARGKQMAPGPINSSHMDFRLGRHHMTTEVSPNLIPETVAGFCAAITSHSDAELARIAALEWPEEALLATEKNQSSADPKVARAATVAAARPARRPSLQNRIRTWLRKGHLIPLTRLRVVIDILKDGG